MHLNPQQTYRYYVGMLKQQEWIRFDKETDGLKNDIAAYLWQNSVISRHKKREYAEVVYHPLILMDGDKHKHMDDDQIVESIIEKFSVRFDYEGAQNCEYVIFAIPENPPKVFYYKPFLSQRASTENFDRQLIRTDLRRIDANFLHSIKNYSLEQRIR